MGSVTMTATKRARLESAMAKVLDRVFRDPEDDVGCTIAVRPGMTDIAKPEYAMPVDRKINETMTITVEIRLNGGATDRVEHHAPEGWAPIPGLHGTFDKSVP